VLVSSGIVIAKEKNYETLMSAPECMVNENGESCYPWALVGPIPGGYPETNYLSGIKDITVIAKIPPYQDPYWYSGPSSGQVHVAINGISDSGLKVKFNLNIDITGQQMNPWYYPRFREYMGTGDGVYVVHGILSKKVHYDQIGVTLIHSTGAGQGGPSTEPANIMMIQNYAEVDDIDLSVVTTFKRKPPI